MKSQEIAFAVITQDGVVTTVGRSTIEPPIGCQKEMKMKWYPEERKDKK